jgi:hypothetical protein
MRRYDSTTVTKRFDGKRVFKTTHYPTIAPADSDLLITSTEGDYLDTLAYKYYGDPSLWWVIALVNNLGKGRMSIEQGLQLRIPMKVGEIVAQFNSMNSE